MRRYLSAAAALAAIGATAALGSGGGPSLPAYVTADPRAPADLSALAGGRLGIVKGAATASVLYLDWRLLNGLTVGTDAATALANPCCDAPTGGEEAWLKARAIVPTAAKDVYYIATERQGPNYTTIPTCFDDAFAVAAQTLADRAARFGAASPAVAAWLGAQDAVFAACSKPGIAMPAPAPDAPAWLAADRAYQQAALALYDARFDEAARGFAAIARDKASPWQPKARYLEARTLLRAALTARTPERFASARKAIDGLARTRAGAYGKSEVGKMRQILAYRADPTALLATLERDLGRREASPDIAVAFRDYIGLADKAAVRPEAADWIRTVQSTDRTAGLAHAQARWAATRKPAWLLAALSLAMPQDTAAGALARDAAAIAPREVAWLTAQYHLTRLTMGTADPATTRARIDAILARGDLAQSDRNVFLAIRTQLATDLGDFTRHALRRPYCYTSEVSCADGYWPAGDGLVAKAGDGFVGLGGDARAIVDRLPLAERMALGDAPALPRELRLDLALTNYARAVQMQDDRAIGRLATTLADLLPQLAADWRAIAALPPGPDRRFAEFLVMAKIPSLRTDLEDYERPSGEEREFGGAWVSWLLLPRSATPPSEAFAPPADYTSARYADGIDLESGADLACHGQCGRGAFALHIPAFVEAWRPRAVAERGFFKVREADKALPSGATSPWEEMLAYARAHPRDPRSPEALYRLIRVGRWGGSYNRSGKRAFELLHARYPASDWTKRSPYYYD